MAKLQNTSGLTGLALLCALSAPVIAAEAMVEAVSTPDYTLSRPEISDVEADARVHGAVCRTTAISIRNAGMLRLERLDRTGKILDVAYARSSRELSGQEEGCAFYDHRTGWRLAAGQRIRICIRGRVNCG